MGTPVIEPAKVCPVGLPLNRCCMDVPCVVEAALAAAEPKAAELAKFCD